MWEELDIKREEKVDVGRLNDLFPITSSTNEGLIELAVLPLTQIWDKQPHGPGLGEGQKLHYFELLPAGFVRLGQ